MPPIPPFLPGQNALEKSREQVQLKASVGDTLDYFLPKSKQFKFKEIQIMTVFLELTLLLIPQIFTATCPPMLLSTL